jgi:vancomycin resistance protein VanJ
MHPFLARKLRRDLATQYPYQAARTLVDYDEFVLLSRFPITETEYFSEGIDPETGQFVPNYMRAILEIDGQAVIVYVFHPPNPNFNRIINFDDSALETEVEAMVRLIERQTVPVLVICDCNSTPRSRQYRLMDEVLDNAFGMAGSGFGLTYPAARPIIRIDHIWFSDAFTALDAEVVETSGTSDHRPLHVTLDFHP